MKLFRYNDVRFASLSFDLNGEWAGGSYLEALLMEYEVRKETPKGFWIDDHRAYCLGKAPQRWVSKSSKKRFAYADKNEAWKSFKARKQRQIQIYTARLEQAQEAFALEQPK